MSKKILVSILTLCMMVSLCACSGTKDNDKDNDRDKDNNKPNTENVSETNTESTGNTENAGNAGSDSAVSGKVHYTVKVVDENNNPIAGVLVQLCSDTCFPTTTNADGVAEWDLEEAEYKASFLNQQEPAAGYTYSTDAKDFYFEKGATELTIVLKAVK